MASPIAASPQLRKTAFSKTTLNKFFTPLASVHSPRPRAIIAPNVPIWEPVISMRNDERADAAPSSRASRIRLPKAVHEAATATLRGLGLQVQRVRREIGYGGPRPSSLDLQHVRHCQVLPDRQHLLGRLPTNGTVAELGVAEGHFSSVILKVNRPKELHLIDTWGEARYAEGYHHVRQRFSQEIAKGQVVILRDRSTTALQKFPDSYFDWVYIDTDHTYETTLAELRLCSKKVRAGGYIAGHDFSRGNPEGGISYGVLPAVHQFCVEDNWKLAFITVEYDVMFSFCLCQH